MKPFVLSLSNAQADLETVGGKGMSLARMVNAGLPVPEGFHITTEAYRHFVTSNRIQMPILKTLEKIDAKKPSSLETASLAIGRLFAGGKIPEVLANDIVKAYLTLPGSEPAVAVRSSATAEDLPEASFAGQQDTYLNIHGADGVLNAVKRCWASLWTSRAIAYRIRQNIPAKNVALAVVVQLLVPAEAAGILFTANPYNGKRNEMLINAAWGLGEAVVAGVVTPDTITVDKSKRRVIKHDIAEKQVMTIRTDSGTEERPVPEKMKNIPALNNRQVNTLTRYGEQIEKSYGMPMDIEWALADGKFAIVQARPITALPEAPIEWIPPDPKGVFMRASLVDLLPKPLSPLFITLGIPSFIQQMQPMGYRVLGSLPILSNDYFTSINSYGYMNSSFSPRSAAWILFHMLPAFPRLMRRLVPIWRDEMHPEYKAFVSGLKAKNATRMSTDELWGTSQEIVDAAMYYITALLFATMGASAGSEMLLAKVYDKLAKQAGDPPATTFLMGWNNIPSQADKSLYDLATYCRERPELADFIQKTDSGELVALLRDKKIPTGIEPAPWKEFQVRFVNHLESYGYIIYQLDFAENLPLDRPEPMMQNIKMYLRGEGINPHERQQASEARRINAAETVRGRLKGFRRWAFNKALRFGQGLAEIREDALAEIGLGYPKLREMLRELGQRFVKAGMIEVVDDIFWLEKGEIDSLVAGMKNGKATGSLRSFVEERKTNWDRFKTQTPPPMIPMKKRIWGIKTDTYTPKAADAHTNDTLQGAPTSPGVVTAQACVLHGPEDFDKMHTGHVLVAGTTTPAWTPLFSMASAVVTDIGGPLSHGSIVAREYGIPAVMGTGVATIRIHDGQVITVDGNAGKVILTDEGE